MPNPDPITFPKPIGFLVIPTLQLSSSAAPRGAPAGTRIPFLAMHYAVSREQRGLDDRPTCVLGDVVITRSSDALSALFASVCASGRCLSEVELSVSSRGPVAGEVQRLRLREVTVTGFQFVADPTNGSVNEVIRLRYGEREMSGYSLHEDGTLSRSETASWRAEAHELAV